MRHQQSEPQNLLGNKLFSQWTKVADVSFSNQRIHQPNKSPVQTRPFTPIEHDPKAPLSHLRDAVKVQINGKTLLLDSPREAQPRDRTPNYDEKLSSISSQQNTRNRAKNYPPYPLVTEKGLHKTSSQYSNSNKISPSRSTTAVESQPTSTTKIYKIFPEFDKSQSKPPTPLQKDWRQDYSPTPTTTTTKYNYRSEGFPMGKDDRGNTDNQDNLEWGSEIFSVETPRNTRELDDETYFMLKPPKQQAPMIHKAKEFASMGTTARCHKVAETISFWKKDAQNSKNLKEKFGMKKENDLVGLKQLLLSMDSSPASSILKSPEIKPGTAAATGLESDSDSDSDDSDDSDEPKESVLPLPYSFTYQKPPINKETPKPQVYTYNPFISRENSESNLSDGTLLKPFDLFKDGSNNTSLTGIDLLQPRTPMSDEKMTNPSRSRQASRVSFHGRRPSTLMRSRLNTKGSSGSGPKPSGDGGWRLIIMIKTWIIIKRALKFRYLKNRTEVYRYDPRDDPPVVKVVKRNKELIRKRDRYNQEDQWFQEKNQLKIVEESVVDPYDFTGYSSLFSVKISLKIPAGANHPGLGKTIKAGYVEKVTNKAKICHQRWLILRSFNLYWYVNSTEKKPQGVIPLPTLPMKDSFVPAVSSRCLTLQQVKGRELVLQNDAEWKNVLSNEMAFKKYMEFVFENQKKVNVNLVEYFEDEDCKVLNLSQDNLNDPILQKFFSESLHSHQKLKELNLAKIQIKGKQLEELLFNLSNMRKSSRLEVLNLDSNGITQESMEFIASYLKTEVSFSLKKLTLANNPIGDEGVQKLLEGMLIRFEKMNADLKKRTILPLTDLDLCNTRMGDQSVFTLITVFEQINKRLGDKTIDDHKDLLQLNLADNMISDNGLRALAKSLTTFYGVKELNLSNNVRLTGAAFDYLMAHLKKSKSLAEILYHKNAIDLKGLENLFMNLAENFLLKRLKVSITMKHIAAFLNAKDVIMDFYKIVPEKKENTVSADRGSHKLKEV